VGIIPVGTFVDSDAFGRTGGYTLVEVEGITVAVVAFTKGMDNLGLPEGSEKCVNLLYEDYTTDYKRINTSAINSILRDIAADEPDITIALLHWGSENNDNISSSQKAIRDLMISGGVDVIIGTHSHLLQAIEFDESAGTLVAWSLGDFYGDADQSGSNYSVMLDLKITEDELTGAVSLTDYSVIPIYTLKPEQSVAGGQRVVQIEKAIARYEGKYIGAVTEETYENLKYALTRIDERITGK
jgi:poly-gamma-glutamate synthesis protein (capsule biosynthesis protein)